MNGGGNFKKFLGDSDLGNIFMLVTLFFLYVGDFLNRLNWSPTS